MFNPIQMLTSKILKVIRKPRNPRPCNRKNIRKALLNLTEDDIEIKDVNEELNHLINCNRKIIYNELNKLCKLQLLSIKTSITASERTSDNFIDYLVKTILTAVVSVFISILFTLSIEDFSDLGIPKIKGLYITILLFSITFIVFLWYIPSYKNNIKLPKLKDLLINFIDYILAKRNDDMQV